MRDKLIDAIKTMSDSELLERYRLMIAKEIRETGKGIWNDFAYYKAIKAEILNRMKKR